jgi:uncharacterized Zn-binding protein involved in type VI secretion
MPPAARVTDMHVCPMVTGIVPHVGGPILPPAMVTVLIGGLPAARVTDMAVCVGPPDMIVKGSMTVLIGNMPAARIGDMTVHGGTIVMGCPTVIIGDAGGGGGGSGGGGGGGAPAAPALSSDASNSGGAGGNANGAAPVVEAPTKEPKRDGFKSRDEAARAALKETNGPSIKDNREYAGLIYKNKDGTYGYSPGPIGTEAGASLKGIAIPSGSKEVGYYHTHGDYSIQDPKTGAIIRTSDPKKDDFDSDNFSNTDKNTARGRANGDKEYRGYLATPGGVFKSYNPSTKKDKKI